MTDTATDPEVMAWQKARRRQLLTDGTPGKFAVSDDLYGKLRAEAERTADLLGSDLVPYCGGLLYHCVPVVIAAPAGED